MTLGTVSRVFNIIGYLREQDGATATDVANQFDLPLSTSHDYLSTLHDLEYVTKDNSEYQLAHNFFHIGAYTKRSEKIVIVGHELAMRLADQTGETAWLVAEEFGKSIYLDRCIGEQSVETRDYLGEKQFLHCSASGKAILAHLPEERVNEIIDRFGLPGETEETITDRDELMETLSEIREQNYALSNQETETGTAAVAAPVIVDGQVYGSVAVTGPMNRIWREEKRQEIINVVLEASNEIELRIVYQ